MNSIILMWTFKSNKSSVYKKKCRSKWCIWNGPIISTHVYVVSKRMLYYQIEFASVKKNRVCMLYVTSLSRLRGREGRIADSLGVHDKPNLAGWVWSVPGLIPVSRSAPPFVSAHGQSQVPSAC
jgi:hypothetical protein